MKNGGTWEGAGGMGTPGFPTFLKGLTAQGFSCFQKGHRSRRRGGDQGLRESSKDRGEPDS